MDDRLKILLDSDVINRETYDSVNEIYEKFFKEGGYSKEKIDLFFTHLAMCIERVYKGESIDYLDDSIVEEIKSNNNYEKANQLLEEIKKETSLDIPESEENYLFLHLVNILN